MSLDEIRTALALRPFRPFRLYVTDGASYDVSHPDLLMPGNRAVVVGIPAAGQTDPLFDRFAVVDLIHITRIEPLPIPTAPGSASA